MKLRTKLRSLALAGLALAGLVLASAALPGRAHAQASVTFGGGLGAPLTLTLNAPVVYSITTASFNSTSYFIFQGTGSVGDRLNLQGTGTITFRINTGAPITINTFFSGFAFGSVPSTDSGLYNDNNTLSLAVGDTVQLLAGTFTTTDSVSGAAPASGLYPTYIAGTGGVRLTGTTVAPEPSTWALVGMSAVGTGLILRRRAVRV